MRYNEPLFVDDDIICSGQVRCDRVQSMVPTMSQPITGPVEDWKVNGNLRVEGRSDMYVSSVQYLTVGNTVPSQDISVDLGSADAAFRSLHVSQVLQTSCAAKKQDIVACEHGLDLVRRLSARSFTGPAGWRQHGLLADEVAALDPTLVRGEAVDYTGLIPVLVNAVQELAARLPTSSSASSGGGC